MKAITYSLFGESKFTKDNRFVFDKYLLGVYFNARMNRLIYPTWEMVLIVDKNITFHHQGYLNELCKLFPLKIIEKDITDKCEGMMYRFYPVYDPSVSHVLCRDLDSVTTYREAMAVQAWIHSGKGFHAIHDNPAHSGLMGGMIGIDTSAFKATFPEYNTFEKLIEGYDLKEHGSDQNLIASRLTKKIGQNLLTHKSPNLQGQLTGISPELWESNLCINFIGSAGVNEMELLRFFQRFDDNEECREFEKEFNYICYWRR